MRLGAFIILLVLVSVPVFAANDPGHDTLYVLLTGDSNVTGSINLTETLTASNLQYAELLYGDQLDIRANGSIQTVSSRPAIQADSSDLYLDSTSNIYVATRGGTTGILQLGPTSGAAYTLNVSGIIYEQNERVCLANGTNCPTGGEGGTGNISGSGTTNYVTKWTSASGIGDSALYDDGTNIGLGVTSPQGLFHEKFNTDAGTWLLLETDDRIAVNISSVSPTANHQYPKLRFDGSIDNGGSRNIGVLIEANSESNDVYQANDAVMIFDTYFEDGAVNAGNLYSWNENDVAHMVMGPNGSVGIGDSAPTATLHVDGTTRFEDFTSCTALETDGSGNLVCGVDDGGSGAATNSTAWNRTGTDVILANTGDNVGIGTNSPSGKLDVVTDSVLTSGQHVLFNATSGSGSNDADVVVIESGRGDAGSQLNLLRIANSVGTKLVVDGSGNVGIGTATPSRKLEIAGNSTNVAALRITQTDTITNEWDLGNTAGNHHLVLEPSTDASFFIRNSSNNIIAAFETNDDIYFTPPGNVGIGTTAPGEKLHVNGSINVTSTGDVCISGGNCLSATGMGSMDDFTLSADGGSDQTISDGNTLEVAGGTSITTTASATDTVTIDVTDDTIDGSELADTITLDATLAINSQDVNFDSDTLVVDVSEDRVGIGTATPSAGLHVNAGTGSISDGIVLGDGDTGLYEVSDDTVAVDAGGTEVMRFNSVPRVGIGTTSLSAALNVGGDRIISYVGGGGGLTAGSNLLTITGGIINLASSNIRVDGFDAAAVFNVEASSSGTVPVVIQGASGQTADLLQIRNSSSSIILGIDDEANLVVTDADGGSVTDILQIYHDATGSQGTGAGAGILFQADNTGNNKQPLGSIDMVATDAAGNMAADFTVSLNDDSASETERFRITSGGNVGIGTTSPTQALHVIGNINSSGYVNATTDLCITGGMCLSAAGSGSGDITAVGSMTSGDAFADATADDDWLGLGASAGRIEFDDQATDEVNILDANVGLGTNIPSYLLHLNDSSEYSIGFTRAGEENYDLVHGTSGLYFRLGGTVAYGVTQGHDLDVYNTSGGLYARFDGGTNRLGLGTNSPSTTLHLVDTTEQVRIGYNSTVYTSMTTASNGRFTIDPTGDFVYLGAGTYYLHDGAAGSNLYALSLNRDGVDLFAGDSGTLVLGRDASNQDLVLEADGQIAIGKTTAAHLLDVDGHINASTINATTDVCIQGGNCLSATGSGSMDDFIAAGDSGTPQTISDGNTLTFDGQNSIVTTAAATDTIQIDVVDDSIDGSELADTITLDATLAINSQDVNFDSNTLYIDISEDAVGIGTTSPNMQLQANLADGGELLLIRDDSTTATDNQLGGVGFDSTDGNVPGTLNHSATAIIAYASEDHGTGDKGGELTFWTSPTDQDDDTTGSERMRITNDGLVGIGTTTPSNELEVNGDLEITNLYDNDASNFFDNSCTYGIESIDSTGAATCAAQQGTGTGNVSSTTTSTDNAIARYDSTTGLLIQNTGVTIDDSDNIAGIGTLNAGATTVTTLDTGEGANELFDMDQNIQTTDAVTFATVNTGSGAMDLGDAAVANGDTDSIPTGDQVYDFVIGLGYGTGDGNVSGSGAANRITYWTSETEVTSNSGFTFDGTDLTIPGDINTPTAFYIGSSATASGTNSFAIGTSADAEGTNSIALGNDANASTTNALAVGEDALASNTGSIAIGSNSLGSGTASVAIGYGSTASNGPQATGDRGVAVGITTKATGSDSTALGPNAVAETNYGIAVGSYVNASGLNSIAIGGGNSRASAAEAGGTDSIAIGQTADAGGTNSIAVGEDALASGDYTLAFGNDVFVDTNYGIAFGRYANSSGSYAIAIGGGTSRSNAAEAGGTDSIAIGQKSDASATNGIAIGEGAVADQSESIALGFNADTTAANQLMIGASTDNLDTYIHGDVNASNFSASVDFCISGGNCLSTAGSGSFDSFTLSADGGSDQVINDGNTLEVAGGDGLTSTASATDTVTLDIDASDFAGTGLEDDGSENLRIAAAAAGNGLTGGAGSALAVGAGTAITVNADDVQVTADGIDGDQLADTITLDATLAVNGQDVNFDSNTLFVDVSEDRVGIGTTTPTKELDVIGDLNVSDDAIIGDLLAVGITSGNPLANLGVYGNSDETFDSSVSSGTNAGQYRNATSIYAINQNDTADTFSQLILATGSSSIGATRLVSINKGATTNDFAIVTENSNVGVDALYIQADGDVGIGTTNPTQALHVIGNINSSGYVNATTDLCITGGMCLSAAGSGSGDITAVGSMTSGDAFADSTADDDWLGLGASAGRIEFDDQATDEVNILDANVGIGTSSPAVNLHVFHDDGAANVYLSQNGSYQSAFNWLTNGTESTGFNAGTRGWHAVARGTNYATTFEQNDLYFTYWDGSSFSTVLGLDSENDFVGIGTKDPQYELDIVDKSGGATTLRVNSTGGNSNVVINRGDSTDHARVIFHTTEVATGVIGLDGGSGDLHIANDSVMDNKFVTVNMTDGSVGIGTTSPDGSLHVHTATAGSVIADTQADDLVVENSAEGGISILTPAANGGKLQFGTPTDATGAEVMWEGNSNTFTIGTATSGGYLNFRTGSQSNAMRITSTGEVGIGTTSPLSDLQIEGASNQQIILNTTVEGRSIFTGYGRRDNSDEMITSFRGYWNDTHVASIDLMSGDDTTNTDDADIRFRVAEGGTLSEAMRIDQSGNVGIGTASIGQNLHVHAPQGDTDSVILMTTAATGSGSSDGFYIGITNLSGTNANKSWVWSYENADLGFGTNNAERMTIDENGNVGIGSTTPTQELHVEGDANVTGTIYYGGNLEGYGADIAEYVHGPSDLEPGDVVIIAGNRNEAIFKSMTAYDTMVAGIVSTDPSHIISADDGNIPLALAGRVPVKVTNEGGVIKRGDLLTTSNTPGHAMKCADKVQCIGAIVGKAMEPFEGESGTITALVMLG